MTTTTQTRARLGLPILAALLAGLALTLVQLFAPAAPQGARYHAAPIVQPQQAAASICYGNTWKTNAASQVSIKIRDINTGERYVGRGSSYSGHISGFYVASGYRLEIVNTGQNFGPGWHSLAPCSSWTKYGEEYRA